MTGDAWHPRCILSREVPAMDPYWMLAFAITITLMLAFAVGVAVKERRDERHA